MAGQELAAIERERVGVAALADRALEVERVALEGACDDADARAVGDDHRSRHRRRRLEQRAQGEQRLAQAVAAGVRIDAGPEQFDQLLARVAARRVERETAEQGGDAAAAEALDRLLAVVGAEAAEHPDPLPRGVRRRARGRRRRHGSVAGTRGGRGS